MVEVSTTFQSAFGGFLLPSLWGHPSTPQENNKDYFDINETKIDPIWDYLIKEWQSKKYHTFYELENHFGIQHEQNGIKRSDLIRILRYAYLVKNFDEDFWGKLLEPMKYPSEASIITYDFDVSQL